MDNDAIFDMKPYTTRQGQSFAIPTDSSEVNRCVEVLHVEYFLMNDRPGVQLPRRIVTGCPDQLHAAIVGALVGVGTSESR